MSPSCPSGLPAREPQDAADALTAVRDDLSSKVDATGKRIDTATAELQDKIQAASKDTEAKLDTTRTRMEAAFVALGTEVRG